MSSSFTSDVSSRNLKPVPALAQLPSELLLLIIAYCKDEHASLHTPQPTLRALCCTNRLLHRLATPVLFEEYASAENLREFVRTIVTRPDLADQVKTIHWILVRRELISTTPPSEVIMALRSHNIDFASAAATTIEETRKRADSTLLDAYLIAVLMHTTNLESLHIKSIALQDRQSITRRWLHPIKHQLPHSFSRLSSVQLTGLSRLSDLDAFLSLHSLRSLTVSGLGIEPTADWTYPFQSSKLEELVLVHGFLDGPDLVKLVNACQALRRFVYIRGPWKHITGRLRFISFPALKAALDNHAPTLHEIDIQTYAAGHLATEWTVDQKVDSFAQYGALRHMTMSTYPLIPLKPQSFVDQLPPNLECLCLDETCKEYFGESGREALDSLLLASESLSRSLQNVYLERECTTSLSFQDWKALKRGLREKDIALGTWDLGRDPDRRRADDWFDISEC
jgi:hypothetical protein